MVEYSITFIITTLAIFKSVKSSSEDLLIEHTMFCLNICLHLFIGVMCGCDLVNICAIQALLMNENLGWSWAKSGVNYSSHLVREGGAQQNFKCVFLKMVATSPPPSLNLIQFVLIIHSSINDIPKCRICLKFSLFLFLASPKSASQPVCPGNFPASLCVFPQ